MTYLDGWKYWCITWRGLEHGKLNEWISVDMEKDHETWNSQKVQKRKDLEESVLLYWPIISSWSTMSTRNSLKKICASIVHCSTEDYKLNSCSKKQTIVTPKNHSTLAAISEKLVEK